MCVRESLFTKSNNERNNSKQHKIQRQAASEAWVYQCWPPDINAADVMWHLGCNLLLVGVLGPGGPCEEVSVRRVSNTQTYMVSYCPSVAGQHMIVVKWADQHITGSPFHVDVH